MRTDRMPYLTKFYPRGSRSPVYKLHKPGLGKEVFLSPEEIRHLGEEIEKAAGSSSGAPCGAGDLK